ATTSCPRCSGRSATTRPPTSRPCPGGGWSPTGRTSGRARPRSPPRQGRARQGRARRSGARRDQRAGHAGGRGGRPEPGLLGGDRRVGGGRGDRGRGTGRGRGGRSPAGGG